MGIIFVSQTGVGVLGNILLLLCYGFISCTGRGIKHMDLILHNLLVANCLVLLSRGIPQSMAALGLKYFMGDFACKLVFYVHRVARGASLSATSLLSGFQAITISLSSPQWMELKVKALKSVRLSIILCWPLHLLVNSMVPRNITAMSKSNNLTEKFDLGFCSGIIIVRNISLLYSMMFSFIDILHLVLMIWASGCMLIILYRHKQKVLHIHSKSLSPKCSPESRATHSILMLVSTFFCFYALSSFFTFYMSLFDKPSWWLVNSSALMGSSFPCVSPFVLISRDPRVSRLWCTRGTKINDFRK
ncbi:vomeronasal type-1 receptor 4-like [Lepus europaeus]|uniref:vomeronasal type-1 receptor 4-like n=1 Tax=Lepus europaeus TaxID=9983 RepID=UPI002B4912C3|nr:vomeronasal type-1 receptor 4-like [Lepus europaeus]XP_062033557.1 vomeronasal type-1 receptor 4-like [Lepus europaeus]